MNLHWMDNGVPHDLVSRRENIGVSYRQMKTVYVLVVGCRFKAKWYTLQEVCEYLNNSLLNTRCPKNEGETDRKWYNRLLWEMG